jgi:GrpB-like predicted nucleotidyltransferase (UPF0157 family)
MSDSETVSVEVKGTSPGEVRMRAVTIGEPQRLDGAIELQAYDAAWPLVYARDRPDAAIPRSPPIGCCGSRALLTDQARAGCATRNYVQEYADAKTEVVEAIIARAGAG